MIFFFLINKIEKAAQFECINLTYRKFSIKGAGRGGKALGDDQ